MIQYDAINLISKAIINDGLVDACFLKGSIARGEEDEFSDVDLYCLVDKSKLNEFLSKRLKYLELYHSLIYWEEVNFVGPQIVAIFDNGLHFDLYTLTIENLNQNDQIMIIYDPKKLLSEYKPLPLQLNSKEIGIQVNEFSYTMIEYFASYKRGDYVFAFKLANYMHSYYSSFLRSFKDPTRSKIGVKGFLKKLKDQDLQKYIHVTKLLRYETSLLAVKTLIVMMHELIVNLPISIAEVVNFDFFLFGKKLIYSIDEEKI
jgi:predicted nucleotidyltransferase